jgi:hypothetical protein
MVAARWRLRRVWRFETAMLDIEMDAQSEDFGKRFLRADEDMRGSLAFSSLVDKSQGISTILRYDIHLTRTFRKALDALHNIRRLQSRPTEPPKSSLNGENQPPTGAPPEIRHPKSDIHPEMPDDNPRKLQNDPTQNQHPTDAPPTPATEPPCVSMRASPPTNIQNPTSNICRRPGPTKNQHPKSNIQHPPKARGFPYAV